MKRRKTRRKKSPIYIYIIMTAIIAVIIWAYLDSQKIAKDLAGGGSGQPVENSLTDNLANDSTNDSADLPSRVLLDDVPFTSQAPTFEWSYPRQQDGCEEASILMAARWLEGKGFASSEDAKIEILKLSQLAEEMLGAFEESSVPDTQKLFARYIGKSTVGEIFANITIADIKAQLAKGKVALLPFDGRKLHNPYYTGEGPDRHFLVVIGYNDAKGVFITNDPGTRHGRHYEYPYQTLYDAILDYPTGKHIQYSGTSTRMLVVGKN